MSVEEIPEVRSIHSNDIVNDVLHLIFVSMQVTYDVAVSLKCHHLLKKSCKIIYDHGLVRLLAHDFVPSFLIPT